MTWQSHRASAAVRTRYHKDANHPEALEAKRKMREELWTERVEKLVAEAPPLTDEQRVRIAALLLTAGGTA